MSIIIRVRSCISGALLPAVKTGLWIIKITVPVSFAVLLLKITGLLFYIANLFTPLFSLFGLPGETALVFVTAALVNIYACIGVMETLNLNGHVITIVALMCLISHNIPVETAIQKKTGSSFWGIVSVRLASSLIGAYALSIFLPVGTLEHATAYLQNSSNGYIAELKMWLFDITWLCIKIFILITLLMIIQRVMEEFGMIQWLSRMLKYPLMILGIPPQTSFLWIVANTLGLAYSAGVFIDHFNKGRLTRKNADLLNYHIAVSHSLLEDTLLFVAVGASAPWIIFPRIFLAGLVVWIKRLIDYTRLRSKA